LLDAGTNDRVWDEDVCFLSVLPKATHFTLLPSYKLTRRDASLFVT
jgi:hypothetical protein